MTNILGGFMNPLCNGFMRALAIGGILVLGNLGCANKDDATNDVLGEETASAAEEIVIPDNLKSINITQFHSSISSSTDPGLCVSCHGDMTDKTTLNSDYPEYHSFKHAILDWKCTDCHNQPVDLVEYSGANLMKQVNVQQVCYSCHGPEKGATQLYK